MGSWEIKQMQSVLCCTLCKSLEFKGFPYYEVTSDGGVFSIARTMYRRTGKVLYRRERRKLRVAVKKGGYLAVVLYNHEGLRKECYAHRLVLEAFVGPCQEGMECRHLDGDPSNNKLENICWGTPEENAGDKVRHGTTRKGVCGKHCNQGKKNPWARLSNKDVLRIRALCAGISKPPIMRLAMEYDIDYSAIWRIVHRKSWTHI